MTRFFEKVFQTMALDHNLSLTVEKGSIRFSITSFLCAILSLFTIQVIKFEFEFENIIVEVYPYQNIKIPMLSGIERNPFFRSQLRSHRI